MAAREVIDTVIKSYQDKLKINPGSLVFVQLADAYRKKGSYEEALEVCRQGLTRHPNLLSGLLMMGRVYAAQKEHGEAVDVLTRVIQREPGNLAAHALLSQAFLAMGRYQEAIAEYQKILTLNPEDTAAQQALKATLEQMRKAGSAARAAAPAPPAAPAAPAAAEPSPPAAAPTPAEPAPPAPAAAPPTAEPEAASPALDFSLPLDDLPPEPALAAAVAPTGADVVQEVPAYAAAEELAERGLYEEAIEALQRILETDPDNFMARQKLREVYARREATDAPAAIPAAGAGEVTTEADKITDDEILHLLGLMEGGPGSSSPAAAEPPPAPKPAAGPAPAVRAPEPAPAAAPEPESPVAAPPAADDRPAPAPVPPEPAPAAPTGASKIPARISGGPEVDEILKRLGATAGMRQAYLVAGEEMRSSGKMPTAENIEKIMTLVRMLSDITRRASSTMKQGEVKQVLVFGTEGMIMVSPSAPGILAAVAGSGVNVGLLRIALNDCLKRLGEVS